MQPAMKYAGLPILALLATTSGLALDRLHRHYVNCVLNTASKPACSGPAVTSSLMLFLLLLLIEGFVGLALVPGTNRTRLTRGLKARTTKKGTRWLGIAYSIAIGYVVAHSIGSFMKYLAYPGGQSATVGLLEAVFPILTWGLATWLVIHQWDRDFGTRSPSERRCPDCLWIVPLDASTCEHCHSELSPMQAADVPHRIRIK